ncbi:tetratricopeptide repeat protein [Helicobacter bizzozeronii]|uniref:tetratricopeptide repeat protein n=1 Tax=Helicobacter bizzozeronii TaxID=56877 RepID=UPI00131529E4|nr:SEL1-like repeat protein [Helicobacter bizzozeronii]
MYANGFGMEQNTSKALEYFQKAGYGGNADAFYTLGMMYANGDSVPQDKKTGMQYIQTACDKGYEKACTLLSK